MHHNLLPQPTTQPVTSTIHHHIVLTIIYITITRGNPSNISTFSNGFNAFKTVNVDEYEKSISITSFPPKNLESCSQLSTFVKYHWILVIVCLNYSSVLTHSKSDQALINSLENSQRALPKDFINGSAGYKDGGEMISM